MKRGRRSGMNFLKIEDARCHLHIVAADVSLQEGKYRDDDILFVQDIV